MMVMLYNIFNQQQVGQVEVGYSDFLAMVEDGRIKNVVIQGQDLYLTDGSGARYKSFAPDDGDLISFLRAKGGYHKSQTPS